MILIDRTGNETIKTAIELFSKHYADEDFLLSVSKIERFNHSHDDGQEVAYKIKYSAHLSIKVVPYTTWNPFSRVIGYAQNGVIYVNTRKYDLPLEDRAANFMHESLHILGYSHKGNRVNEYNLNTVPYKIGNMFGEYVKRLHK